MTEERGTYDPRGRQHDEHGLDGVQPIGDILHQLFEERGWHRLARIAPTNGQRPADTTGLWRRDV